MKERIFKEIEETLRQQKTAKRFTKHTLDGYADAANTKCTQYCSAAEPFEEKELQHHDVWLSCDFKNTRKAIGHLMRQKEKYPTLSATLALPDRTEASGEKPNWQKQVEKHCQLVRRYEAGERIFLTKKVNADLGDAHGELLEAGPMPWPLNIWRMW
jgi:hypothetical protein